MIIRCNTRCGCQKLVHDIKPEHMSENVFAPYIDSTGALRKRVFRKVPNIQPGGIVDYLEISDEPVNPDEGSNNVK